jgi:hypothetical protein
VHEEVDEVTGLSRLIIVDSPDEKKQQLAVTVNPDTAEKFFVGTGHTFRELLELSNAGQALPRFVVPASIRATVAIETQSLTSDNVVGILPGTDPVLKNEYVVISAHLDHVGVGTMAGDAIYNGAMDNASGIATLIETSEAASAKKGFKRSLMFLAVTAEEKGLLGSRYYANKPTVPASAIVADLNTDMFLPLFPLHSLIVQGLEESDLAGDVRKTARPLGIEVYSDPEPERNAFVRSDQYSFIRTGVPSISLKVGFTKGSPEHEMVKRWRTERYHAPSDDLAQRIDRQAAEDFNKVYVALLEAVANRPTRPPGTTTASSGASRNRADRASIVFSLLRHGAAASRLVQAIMPMTSRRDFMAVAGSAAAFGLFRGVASDVSATGLLLPPSLGSAPSWVVRPEQTEGPYIPAVLR